MKIKKILFDIIIKIVFVVMCAYFIILMISPLYVYFRFKFPAITNFIIEKIATNDCKIKSDCDEIRDIPKILRNKKIVFSEEAPIFFEPQNNNLEISLPSLDVRGYLDLGQSIELHNEFIDPTLMVEGYLKNREYKIIRAVYHYNCFYCIDSSDYSYVILEDESGNKFFTFLQYLDFSTSPATELSWDEYYLFIIDTYRDKKPLVELVDL